MEDIVVLQLNEKSLTYMLRCSWQLRILKHCIKTNQIVAIRDIGDWLPNSPLDKNISSSWALLVPWCMGTFSVALFTEEAIFPSSILGLLTNSVLGNEMLLPASLKWWSRDASRSLVHSLMWNKSCVTHASRKKMKIVGVVNHVSDRRWS